jgi:hypothetical protein
MQGEELAKGLDELVDNFKEQAMPKQGRYVGEPAKTNRKGVQHLPPAPLNKLFLGTAIAFSAIAIFSLVRHYKTR